MLKKSTDITPHHTDLQVDRPHNSPDDIAIIHGDASVELPKINDTVNLIYIDPPFNTGKQMTYTKTKTTRDDAGDRTGYGGNNYRTQVVSTLSYNDNIDNYINFIIDKVQKAYALLAKNGSFFLHVDYREVHYLKVALDNIFGRDNFMNEIIWSYDYGARSKSRWSCKHDSILWYAVDKNNYTFNYQAIDRIPYMAPSLVGAEKAARGKTPTDVWWNSIVGTQSYERKSAHGYPTQKPLAILERIIQVHSNEGDTVLDFFAGSGTTGVAAVNHGRKAILIDENAEAIRIIQERIREERIAKKRIAEENTKKKEDYKVLVSIAKQLLHKKNFDNTKNFNEKWKDSPFADIPLLASGTKGAFGKNLLSEFLIHQGCEVQRVKRGTKGNTCDRLVNKYKCGIRFSTLWENGQYAFQQIKGSDWDFLLCVGLSPHQAHFWYVRRNTFDKLAGQHTGITAKETKWIRIYANGNNPHPSYLVGGELSKGIDKFLKAIQ